MAPRVGKLNENDQAFRRLLGGLRYGFSLVFIGSMALNILVLASPIYMMQIYDRCFSPAASIHSFTSP